jgi:hypothetical protein
MEMEDKLKNENKWKTKWNHVRKVSRLTSANQKKINADKMLEIDILDIGGFLAICSSWCSFCKRGSACMAMQQDLQAVANKWSSS